MEKRRRERINRSLEELKNLILDQTRQKVRLLYRIAKQTAKYTVGASAFTRTELFSLPNRTIEKK
jgi:hypothetical protein